MKSPTVCFMTYSPKAKAVQLSVNEMVPTKHFSAPHNTSHSHTVLQARFPARFLSIKFLHQEKLKVEYQQTRTAKDGTTNPL